MIVLAARSASGLDGAHPGGGAVRRAVPGPDEAPWAVAPAGTAGGIRIRFMSAASRPTAAKISPPATLRKPRNPVPGRCSARGLRRAALLLLQARKPILCAPPAYGVSCGTLR